MNQFYGKLKKMSTATSEINFTEKCLERHNSVESVNSSNDEYEQESPDYALEPEYPDDPFRPSRRPPRKDVRCKCYSLVNTVLAKRNVTSTV